MKEGEKKWRKGGKEEGMKSVCLGVPGALRPFLIISATMEKN